MHLNVGLHASVILLFFCCFLPNLTLHARALTLQKDTPFNAAVLSSHVTAADQTDHHRNHPRDTIASDYQIYHYGDVLKNLYGADFPLLQSKKLDMAAVCSSSIVNPLTAEGWHFSGAASFIRQWSEASKRTPGFDAHVTQHNYDFRSKFLNDVIVGLNPPTCHIHETCSRLSCKDVVENLLVQDPAIAMAIMYTDKHLTDLLTVTRAQLELFDHVESQLYVFADEEIVKKFTWREDKSIHEYCEEAAGNIFALINTVVTTIGLLAGPGGAVGSGQIFKSMARMGTKMGRLIGLTQKAGSQLSRSSSISSAIELTGLAKTAETDIANAFMISATITNNEIIGALQKSKSSGLAGQFCKNIPEVGAGTNEANTRTLFGAIKAQLAQFRNNTEHVTLQLREDRTLTSNNQTTIVDFLEAGSFFLNDAAEKYFLDFREEARLKLEAYLKSLFIMTTLRLFGSGVHCVYKWEGCPPDAKDVYCVEPNVMCQAFSWLPWEKHQFKVPHWGHRFLDFEGGSLVYGFDTKSLVERSWAYYKSKAFEPGWQGDFLNDAYHLVGEGLSAMTPIHLPVCYDPEGIWQLGELGPDPTTQDKLNHQDKFPSHPPCSCGTSGRETEAFLQSSGMLTKSYLPHISKTCLENSKRDGHVRHDPDLLWFDPAGSSAPWPMYLTDCNMFGVLHKYAQENNESMIDFSSHKQPDPLCGINRATYENWLYKEKYNSTQAACKMLDDENFVQSVNAWKQLKVEADAAREQVCDKLDYMKKDSNGVDQTVIPKPESIDYRPPMEPMETPFNISSEGEAAFGCPLPKPWFKNETITASCIRNASIFYADKKLPPVGIYRNSTATAASGTPVSTILTSTRAR